VSDYFNEALQRFDIDPLHAVYLKAAYQQLEDHANSLTRKVEALKREMEFEKRVHEEVLRAIATKQAMKEVFHSE